MTTVEFLIWVWNEIEKCFCFKYMIKLIRI